MKRDPRLAPIVLMIMVSGVAWSVWNGDAAAQLHSVGRSSPPPWKGLLAGDLADQVEAVTNQMDQLKRAGQFAEAVQPGERMLSIFQKALGPDHWATADARRAVADLRYAAGLPDEGRKALASVADIEQKRQVERRGRHLAEAERFSRSLLELRRKWLGENNPEIAESYDNLASDLTAQGKYTEAEPLLRKALAVRLETLGEDHPRTAISYSNVAASLQAQEKPAEAEPLYRKALAVELKTLGENHPDTAQTYIAVAANISGQGRYAEGEPLYRKALAICLKTVGRDHLLTAISYNTLAHHLSQAGKYAEAEPLFRQGLAILINTVGENQTHTAIYYDEVALNLDDQGKYVEAEPLHRKGLALYLKTLGENHFWLGRGYRRLANNLNAQGKYTEAEPLYRKALAIWLTTRGEGSVFTAEGDVGLAVNLDLQGRYAEAEPLHRKALANHLKALGESHTETAESHNNLGFNLDAQGKLPEAVASWTAAAAILERTRGAQAASGFERSLNPVSSPLPALAVALARQGQPRDAWARWEADLGRGLLDELSARLLRPLTSDEGRRESELIGRLQRVEEGTAGLAAQGRRTQDQDQQLEVLRNQQSLLRGQWAELQNALDLKYPGAMGKPSSLEQVQNALARDAALVGWLDVIGPGIRHHWACVVRHEGDPIWVRILGSGQDGAWTEEDEKRPTKVHEALISHRPVPAAQAEALAQQRLGPLLPHLKDVQHWIVLPSRMLAGLPIEALMDPLPAGSPRPVISYAPSGSMFARLSAPRSQAPGPLRLLALGDPAFPKPAASGPAPTPPDQGIAILAVAPHGTADLFGIKPGDVLLEYNGKALRTDNDLAIVPAGDQAVRVPIKLWRDGEVRSIKIAAGPLGIQSNPDRPAAQVVLAQRTAADVLSTGVRAEGFAPLPGTRQEVQAIAALFPKDQVTTMLGAEATESNLQGLAASDALKGYRLIHLATHGKANPNVAMSSAIFLAAEPEQANASSGTDPAALESAPDGQITAEQIVRTWDLDADLVVLSACESGLGRYAGGEGYLGFAQALFVRGARSLVLSQWRVDDKATALLMTRFYQNLLGRRSGLSKPMPKAEALHEVKAWLRNLTAAEVGSELAALDRGPVRPLAEVSGPPPRAVASSHPAAERPYAHPYYWAAFILVGDPN